ncbi:hypothetical protein A3D07_00980 [Candidatus Curtissbacteria bacterium RIFCSPHIGHO2_02_FULL_42_15]|uniref:Beta-lactamase class A catalytic domain-containing protein n=1 Tax=Candidatus Curtissbacteria bacterium RIFCSPHIGHO2_02_FULL_42_15 TaxID=1797716 RepID=A0A1F5GCQ9_9BACT|nr:MAG: hypothetical protein A3D07_00980 [Candidatus Curtissbacteria bacterium RIFCSPHIGHO2_02_FULL_42_15]
MPFKIPSFITAKIVYLFALFVFLGILSLTLVNIKTSDIPSETPSPAVQVSQAPKVVKETKNQKVEAIVSNAQNQPGKWAIYIKDLKIQNTYELNSARVFGAASVYKLAVMYAAYDAIETSKLKKNDVLYADKTTLDQEISGMQNQVSPPPDQTGTISYTVERALNLMITISDNYSALLLAERLGWANMDKLMEQQGFAEINLVGANSPNITARATGTLLEKIYNKETVDEQSSQEMINLLLAQKVNDRIPKYLPQDVKVAHKTGELETIRNDAGIVYGKKGTYIFVFLTDTPQPLDATEQIALLCEKIYRELEE